MACACCRSAIDGTGLWQDDIAEHLAYAWFEESRMHGFEGLVVARCNPAVCFLALPLADEYLVNV